jgi:hypothetical protein
MFDKFSSKCQVVTIPTMLRSEAMHARRPSTRHATGGGAAQLLLLRSLLTDRAFDALMRMSVRQEMRS